MHYRAPAKGTAGARRCWAVAAGLAVASLSAATLSIVSSPGLGVAWALALILLGPSDPRLDRRLAVNLALAFGLIPVALWVPALLGSQTAGVTVVAIATGTAVFAIIMRPDGLVPVVRWRDSGILLAAVLAGLVALPLRSPGSAERALAMLSTGIDNSYHFAMYLEQRLTAAGSPLIAANADGSGFAFDDYPQWFHKLIAVLAQIGFGNPGSSTSELVRFAQLEWLAFVALAALVTAALLQALPDRVSMRLLVPAIAVTFSLLLGVPGALNLIQGHLSFLIAACAPLVMFLLAFPEARPGVGLFMVLGGLVLVTASLSLLLPMAAAALVPPVLAVWRRQGPAVRWSTLGVVALVAAGAFVLFILGPLTHGGLAAVLRDGTVPRVGLPTMVSVLVGSTALVTVLAVRRRDVPLQGHLLLLLAALGQTVVLGGYMLLKTQELTYYFWKLGLGSLVVAVIVTAHAIVLVRAAGPDRLKSTPERPVAVFAVVLVAAVGLGSSLQTFTAPSMLWSATLPRSLAARATTGEAGDVDLVLKLATSLDQHQASRTRLLATRPEDMNAAHASEWFHALSHSATRRAINLDDGVYRLAVERDDVALGVRLARQTLERDDSQVLVTDPALYAAILKAVRNEQASRVSLVH